MILSVPSVSVVEDNLSKTSCGELQDPDCLWSVPFTRFGLKIPFNPTSFLNKL